MIFHRQVSICFGILSATAFCGMPTSKAVDNGKVATSVTHRIFRSACRRLKYWPRFYTRFMCVRLRQASDLDSTQSASGLQSYFRRSDMHLKCFHWSRPQLASHSKEIMTGGPNTAYLMRRFSEKIEIWKITRVLKSSRKDEPDHQEQYVCLCCL